MRVSVIIPAYNAASVITATLDTIEAQTMPPFEVLVVDDGSVDETAEVARSHSVVTRVIARENGGICPARNDAIEQVQGDLVCNIDADDLWHPLYIERMSEMMARHPEAASGFSAYTCWLYPAEDPKQFEATIPIQTRLHQTADVFKNKTFALPILPSFHVVRRDALRKIGRRPYVENHRQGEAAYLAGVLAAMAPVAEHVDSLGRYRMHSDAVTGDEIDAARKIIPCIEDLRNVVRDREDLNITIENRKCIDRFVASWTRRCARRLGGNGHQSEGRSLLIRSLLRGDRKAGAMALASFVPGLKHRVWCESWRPASVRRAEGTAAWPAPSDSTQSR
jgi:glycosyltransferase involved in cell wall biosynthesis